VSIKSISTENSPALYPTTSLRRAAETAAVARNGARSTPEGRSDAAIFSARQNLSDSNGPGDIAAPIINGVGIGLKFSVDAETGTRIITVIDLETGKIVRQIPSEETVDFLRRLEDRKGSLISIKS